MKVRFLLLTLIVLMSNCAENKPKSTNTDTANTSDISIYKGTASVTQGLAKITAENIYKCNRGRKTDLGEIGSSDGKKWIVPANTNFQNDDFPFSTDLHNSCAGNTYSNAQDALSKLDGSDIIEIDSDGALFTTYIFADNYFEMYVNGVAVGKDQVPFTEFNSSLVRFKAEKPFTIAMKLVDWEEHLGVGCEENRGKAYHAGDGGVVVVMKDEQNNIIATTNENWKAQTFYTAPVKDLSCVEERDNVRYSKDCDDSGGQDGSAFFALHWEIPLGWTMPGFDDTNWPDATTFSNETIGVDNKSSYTNFTNIFDDPTNDANFIWSTNVVLDNEVLVRYTVK
ncbi:hypothetical protein [Neolewinella persica]|uniref:hypothetical protein n=1 Tax=Neolewinella persica TaxID=70998 RepID=UPI0003A5C80B|nr:hypothetical protein [Neolewinella persica]